MKRPRPPTTIGASEFAAALNGENPNAVLSALRSFTETVRAQRKAALSMLGPIGFVGGSADGGDQSQRDAPNDGLDHLEHLDDNDDDNDDDNNDDNNDDNDQNDEGNNQETRSNADADTEPDGKDDTKDADTTLPFRKKFKKNEAWKEDTGGWGNQFVGTSVAKGDTGTVVKGEWPTGFLKAYLNKSPMAIELTGSQLIPSAPDAAIHRILVRRHRGRLSRAIYKAYLIALAELITAAIPIHRIQHFVGKQIFALKSMQDAQWLQDELNPLASRFLHQITANRLADIISVFNDETNNGKGKLGNNGTQQLLSPFALRVLRYLACTTVANARIVTETVQERISDGALSSLLKTSRQVQAQAAAQKQSQSTSAQSKMDSGVDGKSKAANSSKQPSSAIEETKIEAIRLAVTLAVVGDRRIDSFIMTTGSRERKIRPGILHMSLAEGTKTAAQHSSHADKFLLTMRLLIDTIQYRYCSEGASPSTCKVLSDSLGQDTLSSIVALATQSKAMKSAHAIDDLVANDPGDAMQSAHEMVSTAAAHFLLLLLRQPKRSPLLQLIARGGLWAKNPLAQLTKILLQLYQKQNVGKTPRHLLLDALNSCPHLYQPFVNAIPFPLAKHKYSCLTRLAMVTMLTSKGPSPKRCMESSGIMAGLNSQTPEHVASFLMPGKFQKMQLNKIVFSPDTLLVVSTLQFIIAVVRRFATFKQEFKGKMSSDLTNGIVASLSRQLPELGQLLAMRSKFSSKASSDRRQKTIALDHLHLAIDTYLTILPSTLDGLQYDWFKLFPSDVREFQRMPKPSQVRLLETVTRAYKANPNMQCSSNLLNITSHIAVAATSKLIYEISRGLLQIMLESILFGRDETNISDRQYSSFETMCWIDCLSPDSINDFCNKIFACGNPSSHTFHPSLPIRSMLLRPCSRFMISLLVGTNSLKARNASQIMSYILRRCLLFQPNPMLLAEVISKCEAPIDASIKEYAAYLTQTPKELQSKTQSTATEERVQTQVLPGLFARDPVLQTLRKFGHDASVIGDHDGGDHDQEEALSAMCKYSGANLIVALRALFHLLVVADSAGDQLGQEQQQKRLQHRFSTVACIFVQKVRNGEIPDGIVADDFLYRMIANIDSNQKLVIMMLTASQAAHGTDRLGNDVSRRLHTRESGQGKAPDLDDTLMENILVAKIVLPHVPPESAIAIKVALAKLSAGASASLGELVELTLNEASYDESHILPSPRAAAPAARTTALSLELTADVFNTWWSMACDSKEQSRTFATHLTQLVSSNACSNDDHSSTVMALLVRKPADVFAKCCLGCAKNSNIKVVDDLLRIIRAVSDFDGGYLQDTAVGIATKTHPDSFTRWQQYVHNYIAARMKARVDDASQAQEEEQQLLVRQQRQQSFNFFLLQLCATDSMDEAEVLLHVIEELVTNALPDHYPDDLWDRLGDILNHQADMTIGPRQIDVGIRTMKLATTIMHAISKTESSDPSIVSAQSLSTSLLHGACRYMLRVRKQKNRLMKKFDEFDVDGALSNIMLVICDIAQNRLSHRHTTPERDTAALLFTQVVRRVLKDGIVANAGEVQTLCLKVARLVVCDFHNTTADKTTGLVHEMDTSDDNGQTLESSDIFEMIVSHSQFAEAFSNESASNDYTTEMMKLIICCYSTAASKPTVDAEVWAVLAKPFRAGTTLYDQLFREFYIQNRNNADGKASSVPHLDSLRWNTQDASDPSRASPWDWLLESLDVSRVHATIEKYPRSDSIAPISTNQNDGVVNSSALDAALTRDAATAKLGVPANIFANVTNTAQGSTAAPFTTQPTINGNAYSNADEIANETTHGRAKQRQRVPYSPAFLLPLLLASLEFFNVFDAGSGDDAQMVTDNEDGGSDGSDSDVSTDDSSEASSTDAMDAEIANSRSRQNSNSNSHNNNARNTSTSFGSTRQLKDMDDSTIGRNKMRAEFVQKLCDRGGLSIAMASLASMCPSIRQMGICIVGMILKVCQSEEARRLASWRQRPQLVMLINSIQRALAIRHATGDAPSLDGSSIPRLPGIVAYFIAKSCFIIARPEDPMFAPMNRYYLKSSADHGAFQDLNRVPGFMAFFCSASEDAVQAHSERVWALQLLLHGCIDEHCFTLVAACHAPELIMSHAESLMRHGSARGSSHGSSHGGSFVNLERELMGVWNALRGMLNGGQKRAVHHLVSKLGLLTWLSCEVAMRSDILASPRIFISLLDLVHEAAMGACNFPDSYTSSTNYLCEIRNLIAGLVSVASRKLGMMDEAEAEAGETIETSEVLKRFMRTIRTLGDVVSATVSAEANVDGEARTVQATFVPPGHHGQSLEIRDVAWLLKQTASVADLASIVNAIVHMPINIEDSSGCNNVIDSLTQALKRMKREPSISFGPRAKEAIEERCMVRVHALRHSSGAPQTDKLEMDL